MTPEYEDLVIRLIVELNEAEHGDHLPLADFFKPEKDAQRVSVAVCDNTKMTPEHWAKLTEAERVPWLRKTLAAIAASNDAPRLVTVREVAAMVHREPKTIRKSHTDAWGKAAEAAAGRRPARWRLDQIRPILAEQFPDADL